MVVALPATRETGYSLCDVQLSLFDPMTYCLSSARLAPKLRALAEHGSISAQLVEYPGWLGQIYSPEAYQVRGKFSQPSSIGTAYGNTRPSFP